MVQYSWECFINGREKTLGQVLVILNAEDSQGATSYNNKKAKESGWYVKYGNTYYNPPLKLIVLPFLEKLECSAKMQRSLSTGHIEKSNCFFLSLLCVLQWQALSVKFHTCVKLSTVKNEGSHFNSGLLICTLTATTISGGGQGGGRPPLNFWHN